MLTSSRLAAALAAVVVSVVATAAPAAADAPATWASEPGLSTLELLGLLFGIPILLAVVITLLALPLSRHNFRPKPAPDAELQPAGTHSHAQH